MKNVYFALVIILVSASVHAENLICKFEGDNEDRPEMKIVFETEKTISGKIKIKDVQIDDSQIKETASCQVVYTPFKVGPGVIRISSCPATIYTASLYRVKEGDIFVAGLTSNFNHLETINESCEFAP